MTEDGPVPEVRREGAPAEAGMCCCVLHTRHMDGVLRRIECNASTSGVDDPFCADCEDRHADHPGVMFGVTQVSARLRRGGTG